MRWLIQKFEHHCARHVFGGFPAIGLWPKFGQDGGPCQGDPGEAGQGEAVENLRSPAAGAAYGAEHGAIGDRGLVEPAADPRDGVRRQAL